ncbi:hypothetical protein PI124_g779 [Phytophthora idaei]|nr:hypothetical protein PI124_g779 [Phytophthora idaei]
MDLGGLWDATVGKYTRSELWPAYCCAVPVWTLLGPFRDVAIAFALQVWRVVKMNGGMWYESAVMYQDVLRDPKLRQLEGPTYAYALWNALFTIPVHVLGDGRAEYGHYGRMVRSWWIALQVTYGDNLSSSLS